MGEFLVALDGELEIGRRTPRPTERDVSAWLAVERAVDLDDVEALGVEGEFVEPALAVVRERIADAIPRAPPSRVIPPRCPDAEPHTLK